MLKCKMSDLLVKEKSGIYGLGLPAEQYSEEKIRYLRISDIDDSGCVINTDMKSVSSENIEEYILQENDLVVARTGNSTGRTYMYKKSDGIMAYAGFLIKYVFDETKINPRYMRYFCLSDYYKSQIEGFVGSTRGNMSAQDFKTIHVFYPDRSSQDKMVRLLDLIEEKIEVNNRINDNLAHQINDVFSYWFNQFDFPDSSGKPYKSSGGKMIWNNVLKREIPDTWTVESFGDICTYENGDRSSNYPSVSDFKSSGIPFINGGAIEGSFVNSASLQYITEEKFQSLRAGKANRKDILLTLRGSLEKCVYSPFDKAAIASALVIIRAKNDIPTSFVYHSLISDYFRQLCRNYNNGSVQANLSVDVVSAFPCIIPDSTTLNRFAEYADRIDDRILQIYEENEHLQRLRHWLLPMLMSGQATIAD